MTPRLIELYRAIGDHTAPECAHTCRVPHSCCDAMYCDLADEIAQERGITLPRTDHPHLKFMGPTGCTLEPHLRPLCTLHTCAINAYGHKPHDPSGRVSIFGCESRSSKNMKIRVN